MDLDRMLERCQRGQWNVDDLNWTVTPRSMARDEEMAVVQYFTDMASIERLAKALFVEQKRRATDRVLRDVFASFVIDEERHAQCAERLARHYDVHHYKTYGTNHALLRFAPHFIDAVQYLSAEVANTYITSGELLLDVALLRSLDDYVDDDMSKQAMKLINRDESRHIAIDYYMVEYYTSATYQAELDGAASRPLAERVRAWQAFSNVLFYAAPFFRGVFLEPMERADPTGRRVREAMKRLQLLGARPEVADRPFPKFITSMRKAYAVPALRAVFGPLLSRLVGVPGDLMISLHTDAEARRAAAMTYDELAKDALAAKNLH